MKDIFRPTKAKIIVTLLLPLYIGMVIEVASISSGGLAAGEWKLIFLPFAFLFFGGLAVFIVNENFFSALSNYSFGESVWYFFLEIILPLIINYVIACLLVHYSKKLWRQYKKTSVDLPPVDEELSL
ncbi:hypothetical protein IID19_01070 [Patescibacteria group bacterium]|nr:hypothetical protein [Patescibacteria group bacterium]